MAPKHTVLHSINQTGGKLCVDIFRRYDGSFGFAEYRRDPEDPRGWYEIGNYAARVFVTQAEACAAAAAAVDWFNAP